jgi:replicative DNA helicase
VVDFLRAAGSDLAARAGPLGSGWQGASTRCEPGPGLRAVNIAKQRNGRTGTFEVFFDAASNAARDLDRRT